MSYNAYSPGHPPEPISTDNKKFGALAKIIGAIAGGVPLIFGAIAGLNDFTGNPHTIKRARAASFYTNYYFATAVSDPEYTWKNLTTDDFKGLAVGKHDPFVKYWKTADRVEDVTPEPIDDSEVSNEFLLHYVVIYRNSDGSERKGPVTLRVTLECASYIQAYVPLFKCTTENIRLADVRPAK